MRLFKRHGDEETPGDALPEVWGVHPAECARMHCVRMGPT
jgi:hypothetical protein